MPTHKTSLYAALTAATVALTNPAQASIVGINSDASLGAFDSITWSQIGPSNVTYTSPQNVVSNGGVHATVTSAGNQFQTPVQPDDWSGNFASGTTALWTFHGGPDITITLAQATMGFGAQIQSDNYGLFTAQIKAFNARGSLLGTYTENGTSTRDGDGSAIFIGLLDDSADISKIVFNLTAAPGGTISDFAIGSAEFSGGGAVAGVPLNPTSHLLLVGAVPVYYLMRRRKKKALLQVNAA
ncbi:MAG TPA: hypothetical protein VMT72_02535 [Pseudolabrys sp.]|nr:hypothetical protein [Pseudolabrys sp.]